MLHGNLLGDRKIGRGAASLDGVAAALHARAVRAPVGSERLLLLLLRSLVGRGLVVACPGAPPAMVLAAAPMPAPAPASPAMPPMTAPPTAPRAAPRTRSPPPTAWTGSLRRGLRRGHRVDARVLLRPRHAFLVVLLLAARTASGQGRRSGFWATARPVAAATVAAKGERNGALPAGCPSFESRAQSRRLPQFSRRAGMPR